MSRAIALLLVVPCLSYAGPPAKPRLAPAEATRLAAESSALALPVATVTALIAYRTSFEAYTLSPTEAGFCTLLDRADAVTDELGRSLSERRDTVSSDAQRGAAFERAASELLKQLPGLTVAGEAGAPLRDNLRLAAVAPGRGAGALLKAADPLINGFFPVWFRQLTDVQGCLQPAVAAVALERLKNVWKSGPECVRERVGKALREETRPSSNWAWYCDEPAQARRSTEKLATVLAGFPEAGGEEAATRVRDFVSARAARFGTRDLP